MVDRKEIENILIKNVAIVCKVPEESLSMDTRFSEDLKFRSMQAVKLTMLLEDAFDIKMPMAEVRKTQVLRDTVNMVEGLLKEKLD